MNIKCGQGALQVSKKYNLSFPQQRPWRLIFSFSGLMTLKLPEGTDSPDIAWLAGTLGSLWLQAKPPNYCIRVIMKKAGSDLSQLYTRVNDIWKMCASKFNFHCQKWLYVILKIKNISKMDEALLFSLETLHV